MAFNDNDLVRGNDFILYLYSGTTSASCTPVAFGTNAQLQIDGQTISANHKMSCRWQNNLAGSNSYTVSSDSLYADNTSVLSYDKLLAMMIAGEAVKWVLGQPISGETCETATYALDTTKIVASGSGLITSLSINGGVDEIVSCSLTITGSGAVAQTMP